MICSDTQSTKNSRGSRSHARDRQNGGAVLSCCTAGSGPSSSLSLQLRSRPVGAPPVLHQGVVMEPQPGSPASSPGSPASPGSAKATTPFGEEMPASPSSGGGPVVETPLPDEPPEEAPALHEQGRQSTSSSSSSSSAGSAFHLDAANLGNATVPIVVETPLLDEQANEEAPAIEEQGRQSASSSSTSSAAGSTFHLDAANLGNAAIPIVDTSPPDETTEEEVPAVEKGRHSTSSSSSSSSSSSDGSAFRIDAADLGRASAPALPPEDEHEQSAVAAPEQSAPPSKPDERATWSEETTRAADSCSSSSDSGGAALPLPAPTTTAAPLVQTMSPELDAAAALAGGVGFDPDRIPASVFQPRTSSVSQAEWSVASNESLFSIQGAGAQSSADLYAAGSSRSHFDYFYDEAMAEQEAATKLPPLVEGRELAVPGSAGSSDGSAAGAKKVAAVIRRSESGSGGSSGNFSFAFPILAETSPKKKDCVTASLYRPLHQPLHKKYEPPMPQPPVATVSSAEAFVEMTTEEERRRSDGWCCCGCCWFDCSAWSSCCCWCCRWRTWSWRWCQCGGCSCPALCRCSWCPCF